MNWKNLSLQSLFLLSLPSFISARVCSPTEILKKKKCYKTKTQLNTNANGIFCSPFLSNFPLFLSLLGLIDTMQDTIRKGNGAQTRRRLRGLFLYSLFFCNAYTTRAYQRTFQFNSLDCFFFFWSFCVNEMSVRGDMVGYAIR